MALPVNAIGAERFLELLGVPGWILQRLELIERPGVNGTGIWDTGFRGRPFALRTRVDAPYLGDAMDAYLRYCLFSDADPQRIIYRSMDLSGSGVLFQVLDVRAVEIGENVTFHGGLNPPSLGWCECDWDLLPVPIQ